MSLLRRIRALLSGNRVHRDMQDEMHFQRTFFTMPWRPDPALEQEYFIWGATAAMLRNFYRFLAAE